MRREIGGPLTPVRGPRNAGDDQEAKDTVARLIEEGGQRPIDAGPLRRARQLEGLGLLNITLQASMAKPWMTGVKIVE